MEREKRDEIKSEKSNEKKKLMEGRQRDERR